MGSKDLILRSVLVEITCSLPEISHKRIEEIGWTPGSCSSMRSQTHRCILSDEFFESCEELILEFLISLHCIKWSFPISVSLTANKPRSRIQQTLAFIQNILERLQCASSNTKREPASSSKEHLMTSITAIVISMLWFYCSIPEFMGNINFNSIFKILMLFPSLLNIVTSAFDHAVDYLLVVHEDWMSTSGKDGFS